MADPSRAAPISAEGAMLLQITIAQLDIGDLPPERAERMGHLGYQQWLEFLPGDAAYRDEALKACKMAAPFVGSSPALAVFCNLVSRSLATPPAPLDLIAPRRGRQGGARARRISL